MTRKHFQAIADTIKGLRHELSKEDADKIAKEFARMCKGFNGRFDEGRFLQACELD